MRWTKPILLTTGLAAALLIASDVVFAQCAMCRVALLSSPEGQKMASGFNKGILFLLGAPFAVVGTIAFLIFKPHARSTILARRRVGIRRSKQSAVTPRRISADPGLPEKVAGQMLSLAEELEGSAEGETT